MIRLIFITLFLVLSGCAHHFKIIDEEIHTIYMAKNKNNTLLENYSPVFLVYDFKNAYNRIGQPSAKYLKDGREHVFVDPEKPAVYYTEQKFSTEKGEYTNLIYRIHFQKIPLSLVPFYLTSGRNVGVLVFITLDAQNRPILITTVGTCGCYAITIPTTRLSRDAFPDNWKSGPLDVYGETLPWILDYTQKQNPVLIVHLRPGIHRIMDMEIIDNQDLHNNSEYKLIQTPLFPAEDLDRIRINGDTTSFYHKKGILKGHVKGSVKPWETLFLSLISLDLFVGTDKSYVFSKKYDNPFYTSLKPWNRNASDISNFPRFLRFWGWKL